MQEKMLALEQSNTQDLVYLPSEKSATGCRWIYTIRADQDGSVACLKASLVVKGCSQKYGIDYVETISLVAKMASIRLLVSLTAVHN